MLAKRRIAGAVLLLLIAANSQIRAQSSGITCETLSQAGDESANLYTSALVSGYVRAARKATLKAERIQRAYRPIASNPDFDSLTASAEMINELDPANRSITSGIVIALQNFPDSDQEILLEEISLRAEGIINGTKLVAQVFAVGTEGEAMSTGDVAARLRALCREPGNASTPVEELLPSAFPDVQESDSPN